MLRHSNPDFSDGGGWPVKKDGVNVLFQNEQMIVADKPAGWLTTPARTKDDPRPCLGRELQASVGHQIYPVHRLDFEVSGVVLFAKTAEAHRTSQKWFEDCLIDKIYLAETVPGAKSAPTDWVEWSAKILRGKKRTFASPHGQMSLTKARVIEAGKESWKWELMPVTGRPHQLRWALANYGTPIVGDTLYGGPADRPNHIRLKAVSLDFTRIAESDRLGLPKILAVQNS